MAQQSAPLSDEERAELEALRAERAAREAAEQAARERAELEALRAEHQAAQAAQPQSATPSPAPRSACRAPSQEELDEDRRIAEARARGTRLMEPDDDLAMPLGQKIVLAVLALIVIIIVVMAKIVG